MLCDLQDAQIAKKREELTKERDARRADRRVGKMF